jgi:hypothetical protein
MTITYAPNPTATDEITDTVVLDGGLFFQPMPVSDQARHYARAGIDIVVSLPLERLDNPRLTGVTRTLFEASVEARLRDALHAAGYRHITRRREVPGVLMLDARA